jgi:hypothetical protein
VQNKESPKFQSKVLPPSSGQKCEINKKEVKESETAACVSSLEFTS